MTMPLPNTPIKLSKPFDHGHNGKEVIFFCYNTSSYEREKHMHDHEKFMKKCDVNLFRLVIIIFYKDVKRLVESGSFHNQDAKSALEVLDYAMHQLSKEDKSTNEEIAHLAHRVMLALGALDPLHKKGAERELVNAHKQLLNLALQLIWRYERVTYNDIKE